MTIVLLDWGEIKTMESYYDQLSAEVYAIDKKIGHTFGDVEFYRDRLSGCTGKILEPGVGTGRILIPLLESGLDVDGLDMSAAMLAHCKENCKQRGLDARLFQGNMQSTTFKDTYDAIIIQQGPSCFCISVMSRLRHYTIFTTI